jgi:excisionase family DNA binding protein
MVRLRQQEVIALAKKTVKSAPARRGRANDGEAEAVAVVPVPAALMSVDAAASYLSMSRDLLYKLLMRGEIRSIVVGRRFRRVPLSECTAWIQRQIEGAA